MQCNWNANAMQLDIQLDIFGQNRAFLDLFYPIGYANGYPIGYPNG